MDAPNTFTPPQGINFASEVLSAAELAKALCRTASFIQDIEPYGAVFQQYEDWWEHDGPHRHKAVIDVHHLFELVKSPRSLLWATPSDDYVFVGIAPADGRWYLRFRLAWDDDGFEISGRFDITVPISSAVRFKEEVSGWLGLCVTEQDATLYYKSIGYTPK